MIHHMILDYPSLVLCVFIMKTLVLGYSGLRDFSNERQLTGDHVTLDHLFLLGGVK